MLDLSSVIDPIEYAARMTFLAVGHVPTDLRVLFSDGSVASGMMEDIADDTMPIPIAFAIAGMQLAANFPSALIECKIEAVVLLSNSVLRQIDTDKCTDTSQSVISILAIDFTGDIPRATMITYDALVSGPVYDLANRQIVEQHESALTDSPPIYALMEGIKLYQKLMK